MSPEIGHIYEVVLTSNYGHISKAIMKYEGLLFVCGDKGCTMGHTSIPNFSYVGDWKAGFIGSVANISLIKDVTEDRPKVFN